MRALLLSLLGMAFSTLAWSQQDPLYAQYLINPIIVNPAYTGINNNFNASLAYRYQWAGFEGSPQTFNVNVHSSLLQNRLGVGALIIRDQIGASTVTEFQTSFAYKLLLDDKVLSFGMQAGAVNFRGNNSMLRLFDQGDPAFETNENITNLNVGAGFLLKSDKMLLGLSVPRLLPTTLENGGQSFELYQQHFYLLGGYIMYLNQNVRFKPSALVRGVSGSPLSVDLNFNFVINERYSLGAFTRNFNAYGLITQVYFGDKYRLGYTFELPTNRSVGPQFTTHEVFLGVKLSVFEFHDRSISVF